MYAPLDILLSLTLQVWMCLCIEEEQSHTTFDLAPLSDFLQWCSLIVAATKPNQIKLVHGFVLLLFCLWISRTVQKRICKIKLSVLLLLYFVLLHYFSLLCFTLKPEHDQKVLLLLDCKISLHLWRLNPSSCALRLANVCNRPGTSGFDVQAWKLFRPFKDCLKYRVRQFSNRNRNYAGYAKM